MSSLWFTADAHFGHANIAKFCGRPYIKPGDLDDHNNWTDGAAARVEAAMLADLSRRWNERVKPGDTVIHVGDFCNIGRNRGVPGQRHPPEYYESLLNGKIIFITGNHDKHNGLKFSIDTMVMPVGKKLAFIQHRPIERGCEVPDFCEFVICGHVHEKWKTKWVDGVLNINVGLDANDLYPVRQDEVVGVYCREVHRFMTEGGDKSASGIQYQLAATPAVTP